MLSQRRIVRLLLNLSARVDRTLHYLGLEPWSVELAAEGSYIRAASTTVVATSSPFTGSTQTPPLPE